jgi:hypothetical protein
MESIYYSSVQLILAVSFSITKEHLASFCLLLLTQIISFNTLTSDIRDAFLIEELFELLLSPKSWCKINFPFLFLSITRKPSPYLFVADDAFPFSANIMKSYPVILEQSSLRISNYRLSWARTVENTFRLLASVYREFRRSLLVNLDHSEVVTLCTTKYFWLGGHKKWSYCTWKMEAYNSWRNRNSKSCANSSKTPKWRWVSKGRI